MTEVFEGDGPWVESNGLYVKDDEEHGDEVELDREVPMSGGSDTRFRTVNILPALGT